jgi:predicted secreted protein
MSRCPPFAAGLAAALLAVLAAAPTFAQDAGPLADAANIEAAAPVLSSLRLVRAVGAEQRELRWRDARLEAAIGRPLAPEDIEAIRSYIESAFQCRVLYAATRLHGSGVELECEIQPETKFAPRLALSPLVRPISAEVRPGTTVEGLYFGLAEASAGAAWTLSPLYPLDAAEAFAGYEDSPYPLDALGPASAGPGLRLGASFGRRLLAAPAGALSLSGYALHALRFADPAAAGGFEAGVLVGFAWKSGAAPAPGLILSAVPDAGGTAAGAPAGDDEAAWADDAAEVAGAAADPAAWEIRGAFAFGLAPADLRPVLRLGLGVVGGGVAAAGDRFEAEVRAAWRGGETAFIGYPAAYRAALAPRWLPADSLAGLAAGAAASPAFAEPFAAEALWLAGLAYSSAPLAEFSAAGCGLYGEIQAGGDLSGPRGLAAGGGLAVRAKVPDLVDLSLLRLGAYLDAWALAREGAWRWTLLLRLL